MHKGENGRRGEWEKGRKGERDRNRPFPPSPLRPSDLIYGRRPVLEALESGKRSMHKIWIAEGTHGTELIFRIAKEKGIPIELAKRHDLDRRAGGGHHQGVVAQVSAVKFHDLDEFIASLGTVPTGEHNAPVGTVPSSQRIVLLGLDEIQDPQNIGAILRSAGFFGVSGVIMPRWRGAPVGDTAARVSSGAIEHVPLFRVRNLADSILMLQEAGFEVIGADMGGSPLKDHVPSAKTVLIFGSEGTGVRRLVKERCDKLLGIPGAKKVGSLNVAAAAAIFIHHFSLK